jgi:hypothetical protein
VERADHDALHCLPGPTSCFDLFRERTFHFGAPSNPILSTIFKHKKYTTHARQRLCDRLHKTVGDFAAKGVYSIHLNMHACIDLSRDPFHRSDVCGFVRQMRARGIALAIGAGIRAAHRQRAPSKGSCPAFDPCRIQFHRFKRYSEYPDNNQVGSIR